MEALLTILVGIGLSAACGFRIFVPMLILSIAAKSGHLTLVNSFQWIGSDAALIAFSVATVLEIGAYYIPWLDNLLDSIATPAAIVAGTIVTAAMVGNVSPFLKWSLAVIAGGGAAAVVQTTTVFARGASSLTTGGLANPLLATIELGGSVVTSLLAVWVPIVAIALMAVVIFFLGRKFLFKKKQPPVIAVR